MRRQKDRSQAPAKRLKPLARSSRMMITIMVPFLFFASFLLMMRFSSEITTSPLDMVLSSSKISLSMTRPEQLTAEPTKFTWSIRQGQGKEGESRQQQVQPTAKTTRTPLKDILERACNPDNNTLELENNITICVNGTLPPFQHKPPQFVPDTDDRDVFMLQPENIKSLDPNWIDWSWETCFVLLENTHVITSRVVGIQSSSFQHFHDNALPFLYQSRQGLDAVQQSASSRCRFEERILYETPSRKSKILRQEWVRLGFDKSSLYPTEKFQKVLGQSAVVRKRYPRDADQVRVHPFHVQWLRSNLPPPPPPQKRKSNSHKVIWMSRLGAQEVGIFARQCTNEPEVVNYLRQHVHNNHNNLVVYNPSKSPLTTLEELVKLFGDACAIVGLHGGGMYNQFFAKDDTSVIEISPVTTEGLIHGQVTLKSKPKQAHRAIWHNSNLLGQPYWRIHVKTDNAKEFALDTKTMETVVRAISLSGCA